MDIRTLQPLEQDHEAGRQGQGQLGVVRGESAAFRSTVLKGRLPLIRNLTC